MKNYGNKKKMSKELIQRWMETVSFRITEGCDYLWACYGKNAFMLSSWDGDQNGVSSNIIFDLKTQVVYELSVSDYAAEKAYRWINPQFIAKFITECKHRKIDKVEAWDHVEYVTLDVEEDFFNKLTAIINREPYDERIMISVEFTDEELLHYMKKAHELDITFNQLVEQSLTQLLIEKNES